MLRGCTLRVLLALLLALPLATEPCLRSAAAQEVVDPLKRSSIVSLKDGDAEIAKVTQINHPGIDESSALIVHKGHLLTLNDSGGDAALYVDTSAAFDAARALPLVGAKNVDWEAMTTHGDEIFVCDVGDNLRCRSDLMLYRVRFLPSQTAEQPSTLKLLASYPVKYPEQAHDCEAAFSWKGKLHLIVKNRGEATTDIFRFDELRTAQELGAGHFNIAVKAGTLKMPAGEQVTDATIHTASNTLVVLSYGQLALFSLDHLDEPPLRSILLYARQCEAIAFHGDDLLLTNENGEVYRFPSFLKLPVRRLFPKRPTLDIPAIPVDKAGLTDGLPEAHSPLMPVRLKRAGNDDAIRIGVVGDDLVLDGRIKTDTVTRVTTQDSGGLGTSLLFVFPRARSLQIAPDDLQVALVIREDHSITPLRIWMSGGPGRPELMPEARAVGGRSKSFFEFRLRLPLAKILPPDSKDHFFMNIVSNRLRKDQPELILSGDSIWSLLRPGMAAKISIRPLAQLDVPAPAREPAPDPKSSKDGEKKKDTSGGKDE